MSAIYILGSFTGLLFAAYIVFVYNNVSKKRGGK